MQKILIDTDPGADDALALLFALKRPDVRVMGITTCYGNVTVSQGTENALGLIKLVGVPYEVPVAPGAEGPLCGTWRGPVPHIHGENGIGGASLPSADQEALAESACDFIIRMARTHPRELTLVTLGPMTNLALALKKEPALPGLLKNVIFMGGTYKAPGNVSPVAEANIFCDPEAADAVLRAGFDITMVGLDVTSKVRLTQNHLDLLSKYAAPENRAIVDFILAAMPLYLRFNRQQNNCLDNYPVHDPMALLTVVEPALVKTVKLPARVECGGTFCRGMVVSDMREHPIDAPCLSICVDVNPVRAVEEFLAAFMD